MDKLAKDEEFIMSRLGLRANAITQIIRKHMDEWRRKESEGLEATGKLNSSLCSSESDTAIDTSRESTTDSEDNKFEDYFNTGKPWLFILSTFCTFILLQNVPILIFFQR